MLFVMILPPAFSWIGQLLSVLLPFLFFSIFFAFFCWDGSWDQSCSFWGRCWFFHPRIVHLKWTSSSLTEPTPIFWPNQLIQGWPYFRILGVVRQESNFGIESAGMAMVIFLCMTPGLQETTIFDACPPLI